MSREERMAGRRALITGAGGGMGYASALRLASEGAAVAALDIRPEALDTLKADFGGLAPGRPFISSVVDVADYQQVAVAVASSAEALGGLDTIVICAGIAIPGETHELPIEHWRRVIDINLNGAFYTLRYALPHLLAAGGGSVVTVGSVASLVAAGNAPSYDASKGGLLQLTRTVAADYAAAGIRANCILPGPTDTNIRANSASISGAARPQNRRPHRISVPLGRMGTVEEIAALIAFLCSAESGFITGAGIPIDGGWTAI